MSSLPEAVIASDPAAAITVSRIGVHDRQASTMARTTTVARIGMPTAPPTSVNQVTASLSPGLRHCAAWSSTGWSRPATPSLSATAS